MRTITVNRVLKAPIEHVFTQLSDHANYKQFPGVKKSTLVREGKPHKNGVGALREIDAGLAWFQEEITAYERPRRMDYVIRASRPPIEHQGGSVRLEPVPEGTRVNWTTTLHIKLPLIGGLATRLLAPQLERAIHGILNTIERGAPG